ncbi:MAG TPA: diguanylate cyclase [Steroidobacteraceae bacterium]
MSQAVPSGSPSPAARTGQGWLRLRFPPELEAEFQARHRETTRRWVQLSFLVALSTVLGFAVIDHWVLTGTRIGPSDVVRFGLHLPIVLIGLALTSSDRLYARYGQLYVQVLAPVFGFGTIFMATQASAEELPLISARLVLAIFFFYFMLGMSFHAALRTNLIIFAAYAITAASGAIAWHVATYQLFIFFCAILIGGAGSYALEHANRVAFLDRRRLAEVAAHDGLTGLLNRAALEDQARKLWQQAARDRLEVSVLLVDIDHFKAFNDRYGHQAGDQCLRDVAAAVRRAARRRPLDLVARYGGEEFIAVLFGADRAHAEHVAASIREAVQDLRIPHIASTTRPYVTVSIGATTLDPSDEEASHDVAVQLADRALYAVKGRGRDGWSFSDPHALRLNAESQELLKTAS